MDAGVSLGGPFSSVWSIGSVLPCIIITWRMTLALSCKGMSALCGGAVYVSRESVLIALSGSTLIINFNLTSALSGCRRVARGAFCQCGQFYQFALYYNYFEVWPSCYHGRECRHVSSGSVWHVHLVGVLSTLVDVSLWGIVQWLCLWSQFKFKVNFPDGSMNSEFKDGSELGVCFVWLVMEGYVAAAGSVIGQFWYWVRFLFPYVHYIKGSIPSFFYLCSLSPWWADGIYFGSKND